MGIFTREPDLLEALDKEKLSTLDRQHREQLADITRRNQQDAAAARQKLEAAEEARNEGARREAERRHQQAEAQQRAQVVWSEERNRLRALVDAPISDEEVDLALRRYAEQVVRDGRRAQAIAHEARQP
jgi:hypothetical protein